MEKDMKVFILSMSNDQFLDGEANVDRLQQRPHSSIAFLNYLFG